MNPAIVPLCIFVVGLLVLWFWAITIALTYKQKFLMEVKLHEQTDAYRRKYLTLLKENNMRIPPGREEL